MRRPAAAVGLLIVLASAPPARAVDVTSPDVETTGEEPVVATANTASVTFEYFETSSERSEVQTSLRTCKFTAAQRFDGTRNATTKAVAGRFTLDATTSCSPALGVFAVATLYRGTTAVQSTPPEGCTATSAVPCTFARSAGAHRCAPCATGSWYTKSTHRVTVPASATLVNPPPGCTRATPTTVECRLTTSRTTIR